MAEADYGSNTSRVTREELRIITTTDTEEFYFSVSSVVKLLPGSSRTTQFS